MENRNQQTLRKIKRAYETNNVTVIERVNAIFGDPNPLTGVLLEAYNKLGNTPVAESKLYETLTEGKGVFAFAKQIGKKLKVKSSDYTGIEFASFIAMCKDKITLYKNEDGGFKSTPLTENATMPDFEDVELIGEASINLRQLAIDVANGASDDVQVEFEKAEQTLTDLISKVTGVKFDELSEWEKSLLSENVVAYTHDILNTMLGRSL